ncbi:MAG: hypothetical protein QOG48_418 [Verrucomicrobiota bacterium]|jgi:hypothetical protein
MNTLRVAKHFLGGLAILLVLHTTATPSEITFDFAQGDFGWTAGFADYPADADPAFYELQTDYRDRPANLGGAGSIFISGANHSDDLFMFIKKSIAGLQPNSLYRLTFTVELASQYAHGLGGIGGSPGDSVFLKAGASRIEPAPIVDQSNYFRMNIDKGNQAQGGRSAFVLGTIAKPRTAPPITCSFNAITQPARSMRGRMLLVSCG